MGITNSCAKLSTSCFGWKKNKNFRRRRRDLSESIVKLRDDGSIGVEGLPTARIVPHRNNLWDHVFTRREGKGTFQPTMTHTLEPISVPSEDRFVRVPLDREMEGHHFNKSLLSSLPPPIPPRKMERNVCPTTLPETYLSTSNPSTEMSALSEDLSYVQGMEGEKCDETQRISPKISLYSEDSAKWESSKIPPRTFKWVTDRKSEIAGETVKNDRELTSLPPIPPRQFNK